MAESQTPEQSFAAMRESHAKEVAELKGQIESLQGQVSSFETDINDTYKPAMFRSMVRDAGFSQDSKQFAVLTEDLGEGKFVAPEEGSVVEALKSYAADRYGYLPANNGPTANESAALQAARRVSDLSAVATSDVPPTEDEATGEALAKGDVAQAIHLQNQKLVREIRGANR